MTALDLANASAHAAANVGAKIVSAIKLAFARFGAAYTRAQEARLEAEIRRLRHRIGRTDDDNRPTTI